jgi:hypothetical protein
VLLALAFLYSAEVFFLFPLALMMPPSLLNTFTCAIFSDDFATDKTGTDYTVVSGSFTVSGGEISTTSATPLIIADDESTTNHGKATVDVKSSATGNDSRIIGAYVSGTTYVYAKLTYNGASSTFEVFTGAGTQIGPTVTTSTASDTYYTMTICWDGTDVTATLSGAGSCKAIVSGDYSGTGTKAGFGGSRSSGTLTFDNFEFAHIYADDVSCDASCLPTGTTTSGTPCECNTCDPPWTGPIDVDISGFANDTACSVCANVDGVYRLSLYSKLTNYCSWYLEIPAACGGGGTDNILFEVQIQGLNWNTRVSYQFAGTGMNQVTTWTVVSASKPDCESFNAYDLPWTADATGPPTLSGVCDGSGTTCTVTAVEP